MNLPRTEVHAIGIQTDTHAHTRTYTHTLTSIYELLTCLTLSHSRNQLKMSTAIEVTQ